MFLIKNGWFSFKNAIFYAIFMCFIEKIPDFSENEIIEIYKRKEVRWTIGKWEQKKMTYRAAVLVIHSYLCKISPLYEIAVFWYYRLFYSFALVYILPLSYYTFYSCNSILYYCTSTVHTWFDCTGKFVPITRNFVLLLHPGFIPCLVPFLIYAKKHFFHSITFLKNQ